MLREPQARLSWAFAGSYTGLFGARRANGSEALNDTPISRDDNGAFWNPMMGDVLHLEGLAAAPAFG